MIYNFLALSVLSFGALTGATTYTVSVVSRSSNPILSYIDGSSTYQQIFNPTWVEASDATGGKQGIIARTQNCDSVVGAPTCTWCGGAQSKASILTFSENVGDAFKHVDSSSVVFGPSDDADSWGTEDPRMQYNPADKLYYMMYTAYNGSAIFLNLATTPNPLALDGGWIKHGAVFPSQPSSKSGALLIRESGDNYLLWGDHEIRIAKSTNLLAWPDIGQSLIQIRPDMFDSQLVESGPPPMLLDNGDYLFFYNSAMVGWPQDLNTSYNVAWVILDGANPTYIKQRAQVPLLSPTFAWEQGVPPYACNAPNVVFLEAAYPLGGDKFQVFFGGADSTIGSAVIQVTY